MDFVSHMFAKQIAEISVYQIELLSFFMIDVGFFRFLRSFGYFNYHLRGREMLMLHKYYYNYY